MKHLRYQALLSIIVMLSALSLFARDKNQHSVNITDAVQVGSTQLKPGSYKVTWEGAGPDVQVTFRLDGKNVATIPATLKTNDGQVTQDQIVKDSANNTLTEIDFGRDKQAVVFQQNGM